MNTPENFKLQRIERINHRQTFTMKIRKNRNWRIWKYKRLLQHYLTKICQTYYGPNNEILPFSYDGKIRFLEKYKDLIGL